MVYDTSLSLSLTQRGRKFKKELGLLEEKLQTAFREGQLQLLGTPLVGMYACAVFKDDDNLYRAKITGDAQCGWVVLVMC